MSITTLSRTDGGGRWLSLVVLSCRVTAWRRPDLGSLAAQLPPYLDVVTQRPSTLDRRYFRLRDDGDSDEHALGRRHCLGANSDVELFLWRRIHKNVEDVVPALDAVGICPQLDLGTAPE